ncbi:MAG: hypothetical protein P1V51_20370 [Deltaproteobacteria bacterium]|nr:hypothetical protein [Deltaproteobacteria bacterium]
MNDTFPKIGLFVSEAALEPAVIEALGAVRLDEEGLARLRAGGAPALSPGHEAWIEACRISPEALAKHAAEIARLREAMVRSVLPLALAFFSLAATFALGLFAVGFVFSPVRRWAFIAGAVVLVVVVLGATLRAIRSALVQRRLHDELEHTADALTRLRQEGDRPRLYALALDLEHAPREPATVRWNHPASDPERPLVLQRALVEGDLLAWLLELSRARAVIVEGSPLLEHDEATRISPG